MVRLVRPACWAGLLGLRGEAGDRGRAVHAGQDADVVARAGLAAGAPITLEGGASRFGQQVVRPGILGEDQALVFDPFYRSLGTGEAGSGLGLSIVRAIAERTGIRVGLSFVDEVAQRGLRVSLWLSS